MKYNIKIAIFVLIIVLILVGLSFLIIPLIVDKNDQEILKLDPFKFKNSKQDCPVNPSEITTHEKDGIMDRVTKFPGNMVSCKKNGQQDCDDICMEPRQCITVIDQDKLSHDERNQSHLLSGHQFQYGKPGEERTINLPVGKWCLPPTHIKGSTCNHYTGNQVLTRVADGNWKWNCKCKNENLFTKANVDGNCIIQTACGGGLPGIIPFYDKNLSMDEQDPYHNLITVDTLKKAAKDLNLNYEHMVSQLKNKTGLEGNINEPEFLHKIILEAWKRISDTEKLTLGKTGDPFMKWLRRVLSMPRGRVTKFFTLEDIEKVGPETDPSFMTPVLDVDGIKTGEIRYWHPGSKWDPANGNCECETLTYQGSSGPEGYTQQSMEILDKDHRAVGLLCIPDECHPGMTVVPKDGNKDLTNQTYCKCPNQPDENLGDKGIPKQNSDGTYTTYLSCGTSNYNTTLLECPNNQPKQCKRDPCNPHGYFMYGECQCNVKDGYQNIHSEAGSWTGFKCTKSCTDEEQKCNCNVGYEPPSKDNPLGEEGSPRGECYTDAVKVTNPETGGKEYELHYKCKDCTPLYRQDKSGLCLVKMKNKGEKCSVAWNDTEQSTPHNNVVKDDGISHKYAANKALSASGITDNGWTVEGQGDGDLEGGCVSGYCDCGNPSIFGAVSWVAWEIMNAAGGCTCG